MTGPAPPAADLPRPANQDTMPLVARRLKSHNSTPFESSPAYPERFFAANALGQVLRTIHDADAAGAGDERGFAGAQDHAGVVVHCDQRTRRTCG